MSGEIGVLYVESDRERAAEAAAALERASERVHVETAASARGGQLEGGAIDCVVVGRETSTGGPVDTLAVVRDAAPEVPFVLFSEGVPGDIVREVLAVEGADYLRPGGPAQFDVLRDRITTLVEAHRNERAQDRYRALVEEATDVILVVDADGSIQYATPSAEAALGRTPEELVGTSGFEPVHPADRDRVVEAFETLAERPGERRTVEFRYERPDGSVIWAEARGRNLLETPAVEGIVVYTRDITERKRRERELERYEVFVETAAGGVFVQDENAQYAYVNSYIEEKTGYDREEILGQGPSMFMPEEDIEVISARIAEMLEGTQGTVSFETEITTATGETVPAEGHLALLPTEDGFSGTVGMIRDITERKERERELRRQKERLERFASLVSHELRNPLNVAQGRLELAREEGTPEQFDGVAAALDRMNDLIDDLLALAREGREATELEPVALASLCRRCWQTVGTADATLTVATDRTVRADRSRLGELFENLYANAVEHGGEQVAITVGDFDGGFYVADDGAGIPPAERGQVFEAGYSTDGEGTGFGLSIVEEIVEAHGWEITATESASGGARFEITGVEPPAS